MSTKTPNPAQIALYFEPPSHHFRQNRLFEVDERQPTGDRLQAPWAHVRDYFQSRGIPVQTAEYLPAPGSTKNIYVSVGMPEGYRKLAHREDVVLSAFFALECPVVEPRIYAALPEVQQHFRRLFSWSDSHSLEHFTRAPLDLKRFFWPQSFDAVHEEIWSNTNRQFLVMINSNKLPRVFWNELYTERMRAVEFFSRTGDIDLYGMGWNDPPARVGSTWTPYTFKRIYRAAQRVWDRIHPDPLLAAARRVYRGRAGSKSRTLGNYRFALCYENSVIKGWITEKIFDCFFAGAVPVYWGAPDIAEYVPPECFIDRRKFADHRELRDYLHSLSDREVQAYRAHARKFIESESFHRFSKNAFLDIFRQIVREDCGVCV